MMQALFGIDWRRTGPREVVARQRRKIQSLPAWQQGLAAAAIVGGYAYVRPSLPPEARLLGLTAMVGALAALVPAKLVIEEILSDDYVLLEELHPVDGDRATRKLSRDRFEDLRVVDYDGRDRDTSYLVEVSRLVDADEWVRAFEVDRYYPDSNLAVASYMAGASNADLRRFERAVWEIKSELSREADRSLEEIVQAPEARRRAAAAAVQRMIEAAEGIEAPGSHSMIDELDQLRREAEKSVDDLLADRGIDDLEERLSDGDEDPTTPDSVEISIADVGKEPTQRGEADD